MPFRDATEGDFQSLDEGKYVLQVKRLEDAEPGQYGARMKWVFWCWDFATSAKVQAEDGSPFEFWQFTSDKMGTKATARKWAEAFLGRPVANGEGGAAIAAALVDSTAEAYIAPNDNGYTGILRIQPRQAAPVAAAAAPAPVAAAPVAAPAPAAVQDDLPF